ncbi:MAG: hypothetical protein DI537_28415 [Stutzerimonas stutzeri]|nr:MAG: hypothetical protein DI537_28415 [Stutzerimonas stutzeri]
MSDPRSPPHFTVSALDQLSRSLRTSTEFGSAGPLKSMDPGRKGAFAATPGSGGRRNAIQITAGDFRASTQAAHPNMVFAFDNPSVRFGDRTRASSRPVSKDGATSFHFSHSYMSKTSPIQNLIREVNGGRSHFNSKAGDHLEYIERDGAAEELGRRKRYDGMDIFLDNFEALEEHMAKRSSQEQQDYLERAGAAEKLQLRNLKDDEIDALRTASFGTIGATIEERHHFWREVEKLEADPRGDKVQLRIDHDEEIWSRVLENLSTAPEPLKKELQLRKAAGAPEIITLDQVPTTKAFAIYKWAYGIDPDFPIEIEPGRGGRVQNRIIAELPHELDPHERVTIVRDFTNKLTEKGLPFWAVIHAPDENNDRRNYHVHIVYYDRPAAKMPDPNDPKKLVWDFEVIEQRRFPNRHVREVRPHLQFKDREASAKGWVKNLREYWEKVSNAALEEAGINKRYDARTYKEMGIALEPLKHIPSKTFNKERKGELTPDGIALARRQWDVLLEKVVSENFRMTALRRRNIAKNAERVERLITRMNPNKALASAEVHRIAKIADKYAVLLGMAELCQDVTRVVVDRVASRAKLVFHAAFGSTDKKPRGRPRKTPLLLAGPSKALPSDAEEARLFLKTVIPEAQRIDRKNREDLGQVRHRLALMSQRLEYFEKNPAQHPRDKGQPGYIDLDRIDPSPEDMARRREEVAQRFQESVMALAERSLSPALKATVDEVAPAAAPSARDPVPPAQPATPDTADTAARSPSRGSSDRPAYLDEKNPKGTRFRYEPFSHRPDRPQNTKSRASTWKPSSSKTDFAARQGVEDARKSPPPQPTAPAPAPKAPPAPAARPARVAEQDREAGRTRGAQARSADTKSLETGTPIRAAKPAVTAAAPKAAPQPAGRQPITAPAATPKPGPAAQPQAKGSVTLTQKPTLPPRTLTGLVIEGKTPAQPMSDKRGPERPARSNGRGAKGEQPDQMKLPLGRPEANPPASQPVPKKPVDKKGRKKGPDRDRGPER